MNVSPIYNSNDLRTEIARLENLERERGAVIKQRLSSPGAIFSTVISLFKGDSNEKDNDGGIFKQDFVGLISRFVLPLALNKTLFRHSNFVVKALVGLVSQKASNYISEDAVGGIWTKVKSLFNKTDKKKPSPNHGSLPHVPPPVVI